MKRCLRVMLLAGATAAWAQTGYLQEWARMKPLVPRGYVCFRATNSIAVDGRLTEPTWQAAAWTLEFVAIDADSNAVPPVRARAKWLWDSANLYGALELDAPQTGLTAPPAEDRGRFSPELRLVLDPDGDGHSYYELAVASSAAMRLWLHDKPPKDGGTARPMPQSTSLRAAVGLNNPASRLAGLAPGWTFELAIGWQDLAAAGGYALPDDRQQWRMNLVWASQPGRSAGPSGSVADQALWAWSPHGVRDLHRPERWGYLQFSRRRGSRARFIPDPSLAARNALQELYYFQKDFHARHGRWAVSLAELGCRFQPAPGLDQPPVIRLTAEGFEASIDGPVQGLRPLRWHISHDGRFWADPELRRQLEQYYQTLPDSRAEP